MSALHQPEPLLLASSSPRRQALLREASFRFKTARPVLDEPNDPHPHVAPALYAEALAFFKARSVAEQYARHVILAADTIAVLGGEIIGKPADRDDARRILNRLSGTAHEVVTGLVLLEPVSGRRMLCHDVSTIRMRVLPDTMIEAYLDTGAWQGKAGAYGIQDRGDAFIEDIDGSFTNVVGLPMELLAEMFEEWQRGASSSDAPAAERPTEH
ncbi:MAG: Maf family protein [Phycisphaerae bacterium]